MLAELAAANAAFQIVKQAVANSGDVLKAGKAISDFVTAKDDLKKKHDKKKRSIFGNVEKESDLETFLALEEINKKEEELKQIMIYTGRPGLWNDWIRFQAEARVNRQKEKERLKKRRQEIIEITILATAIIFGIGLLAVFTWFVIHLKNLQ